MRFDRGTCLVNDGRYLLTEKRDDMRLYSITDAQVNTDSCVNLTDTVAGITDAPFELLGNPRITVAGEKEDKLIFIYDDNRIDCFYLPVDLNGKILKQRHFKAATDRFYEEASYI